MTSLRKTKKKGKLVLKRGRLYSFTPSIKTSAVSAINASRMEDGFFIFTHGKYMGKKSNRHLFESTPENDTRIMYHPLRKCSFFVGLKQTTFTLSG